MGKRSDALPNIRMDYTGFLYNEWMDDDQRMQGEEFLAENFPGREDIELEVAYEEAEREPVTAQKAERRMRKSLRHSYGFAMSH